VVFKALVGGGESITCPNVFVEDRGREEEFEPAPPAHASSTARGWPPKKMPEIRTFVSRITFTYDLEPLGWPLQRLLE
jgi:hypothetical protein